MRGEGLRAAAAAGGGGGPGRAPGSQPPGARNPAHPPTPELKVGASPAQPDPPVWGPGRGPESPRRLLSPDRGPTARPRAQAAEPRLREKREIAKFTYSQIDSIIV